MYNIIKRYCENEHTNGLFLLDMPTGAGKTYSVVKYMFDAVQDPSDNRKFFFITTLKKNLPDKDLKRLFEKEGQSAQFEEKCLKIDSNYESVISGLKPERIPESIKKSNEYRSLEQYVNLVKNLRNENKYHLRNALLAAEDSLRREAEPKFRKMLQSLLKKKYANIKDRLTAIKTNSEWQWVADLYPSVFMRERQVIFMSVDKFLSLNSTIIEPATMLYHSDILENAIVFIDEFDATKETVLKNIIQNGLLDKIDYIDLFNAVYSALKMRKFPAVLTKPSEKKEENNCKGLSLQDILDKTKKIADDIHDTFSLKYSHRTEHTTDENVNNFLFQDHQYHSILNGNKSYIAAVTDHNKQINEIKFFNERPEKDRDNIQVMLGKLRGFITYFMGAVRILALNYQQLKTGQRRENNSDDFTLEEAVRTVLAEFKLSGAYINYLTAQILVSSYKNKTEIPFAGLDLAFYEKGFRYYDFEDNYAHDMQSKIMMCSFQLTPEKLLLRFCEKAKVLGISATAMIPSAIGNYDIAYLAKKLQDKYICMTDAEREQLEDTFLQSVKGYHKVKIHTQLIGGGEYSASAWEKVIPDKELAQDLFDRIERACSEDNKNYNKERYLRIATAFKAFLTRQNIQSFLCVLTKHPRKNDKTLDLNVLLDIFKIITCWESTAFDVEKNVIQLDGDEYDTKKDDIIKRLSNEERLFVLSVYQTIGAGQNLQHPAPKAMRENLVAVNDFSNKGEKDFDAIYLDMPTNLIPQLTPNLTEEDFIKYIFYVEMLKEKAELSVHDATALIKKAFRCYSTKIVPMEPVTNIYNCRSVVLLATRVIIQAIGRICRTNLKAKDIYVFADSRIADRIDFNICSGKMFNYEFLKLTEALASIAKEHNIEEREKLLQNNAQLNSNRVIKFINTILRENWTDDKMICWKHLRKIVLMYPSISAADLEHMEFEYKEMIISYFYVEMPEENNRIFYTWERDFDNVQVFFTKKAGMAEVSAESSRLDFLMRSDFLRGYFENQHWATSFSPGKYIMSPPLFNNIYRGALGEAVGKALFHHYLNAELLDIEDNDLFELFDFQVKNTSVFVDFKNWHEYSYKKSDQEISHIIKKARECGAKCVIIANIFADGNYVIREKTEDGIKIVIIPSLLKNESSIPVQEISAWEKIRECICEYTNQNQST